MTALKKAGLPMVQCFVFLIEVSNDKILECLSGQCVGSNWGFYKGWSRGELQVGFAFLVVTTTNCRLENPEAWGRSSAPADSEEKRSGWPTCPGVGTVFVV